MTLIVDLCSEPLASYEFVQPIVKLVDNPKIIHHTKITDKDIDEADKIIICGTPLKDNRYLSDKFSWIKKTKKPILGICAGMQAIAIAFDQKLINQKEIKYTKIRCIKKNILFDSDLEVYALHTLAVEFDDKFDILARSDTCIHAIRKDKIYGILFHPETRNKKIIKNFLDSHKSPHP